MQVGTGCANGWVFPAKFSTIPSILPSFQWGSASLEQASLEIYHHGPNVRQHGGQRYYRALRLSSSHWSSGSTHRLTTFQTKLHPSPKQFRHGESTGQILSPCPIQAHAIICGSSATHGLKMNSFQLFELEYRRSSQMTANPALNLALSVAGRCAIKPRSASWLYSTLDPA